MTTHLLYLHGFRSSPQSAKSLRVANWVKQHAPRTTWWCPQLPASPRQAIDMVLQGIASWPMQRTAFIGSSLGGFYATVLAERLGCDAVLLNPAVDPARDLQAQVGVHTAWHSGERFEFLAEHLDELRAMAPPAQLKRPASYFAVIATGDKTLDWREMSERYRGAHLRIVEGSDHALSDFEDHLPHALSFLRLP